MRNLDNHGQGSLDGSATTRDRNPVTYNFLPRRKILLENDGAPGQKNVPTETPGTSAQPLPAHSQDLNIASTSRSEQQILFDQVRLQLGTALQTSLNPQTILETYFTQLSVLVEISGLKFTGSKYPEEYGFGNKGVHTLRYQLDTGKQDVGEIVYCSRSRLSGLKLELLELATSTLVFPLLNAQIHQQALTHAHTDTLTKLANRRSLEIYLPSQIASAHRYQRPLSALIIDIDHFKSINDSHGHQFGDVVLQTVAQVLEKTARTSDRVFRYGGEEFVCILDGTDAQGAQITAERLRKAVASIDLEKEANIKNRSLSISLGFAELSSGEEAKTLLQRADIALYQAKRKGRNCVVEG